jgi:hypothetical protein
MNKHLNTSVHYYARGVLVHGMHTICQAVVLWQILEMDKFAVHASCAHTKLP